MSTILVAEAEVISSVINDAYIYDFSYVKKCSLYNEIDIYSNTHIENISYSGEMIFKLTDSFITKFTDYLILTNLFEEGSGDFIFYKSSNNSIMVSVMSSNTMNIDEFEEWLKFQHFNVSHDTVVKLIEFVKSYIGTEND